METITITKQHRYVVYLICLIFIGFSLYHFVSDQPIPANLTFKYWVALAAGPLFTIVLGREIWRYVSAPSSITWDFQQQLLVIEKTTVPFAQIDKAQLHLHKGMMKIRMVHKDQTRKNWAAYYQTDTDLVQSLNKIDTLPQFVCVLL